MNVRMKSGRFIFMAIVLLAAAAAVSAIYNDEPRDAGAMSLAAEAQEPAKSEPASDSPTAVQQSGDLSAGEIALLQDLSARRQELDAREAGFETRERLLAETEKRIDDKIAKLAELEQQILALVEVQEERDDEKLNGLVRVYERMRPRDAARIIEGLDDSLQLEVATRMRAIKLAAILSVMEPSAARDLTSRLASRASLPPSDG